MHSNIAYAHMSVAYLHKTCVLSSCTLTAYTSVLKPNVIKTNSVHFYLYDLVQSILNRLADKIQVSKTYVLLCRHSLWSSLGLTNKNNSNYIQM
jgi:hypothetical protein